MRWFSHWPGDFIASRKTYRSARKYGPESKGDDGSASATTLTRGRIWSLSTGSRSSH